MPQYFTCPSPALDILVNQTPLNQNMPLEEQPKKWSKKCKKSKTGRGSGPKIQMSTIQNEVCFEIRGGRWGQDFHVFPKFKWLRYGLDLMVYGWDIGNIWPIYGWLGLIMVQCVSYIYLSVTVFSKGQREVQPFQKCLNFKSSPILVREVGHQIAIFRCISISRNTLYTGNSHSHRVEINS